MKIKSLFLIILLAIGYSCSDDPDPVNTGTDIIGFEATQQVAPAVIDNTAHTVTMVVVTGTDRSALAPVYSLSTGAIAVPASGTVRDYSGEVTINVTAQDGVTTQAWKVNVSIQPLEESITDILAFTLAEQTRAATINNTGKTVAIEVVNGTSLTSLTPGITVSPGATSDPASESTGDYSSAVTIVVTGGDASTENWTVTVSVATPGGTSDAADILTFIVPGMEMDALIHYDVHVIGVKMPSGTDLTNLAPTFTLSPGATSLPVSGTAADYTNWRWILVTAEDGTTQQPWKVKIFNGFDSASLCNVEECGNNPDAAQQCITFFEDCMATHGEAAFVPCAIVAMGACE